MSDNTAGPEGVFPEGEAGQAPDPTLEMEARIRQLEKEREEFLNLAKSRQAEFENY